MEAIVGFVVLLIFGTLFAGAVAQGVWNLTTLIVPYIVFLMASGVLVVLSARLYKRYEQEALYKQEAERLSNLLRQTQEAWTRRWGSVTPLDQCVSSFSTELKKAITEARLPQPSQEMMEAIQLIAARLFDEELPYPPAEIPRHVDTNDYRRIKADLERSLARIEQFDPSLLSDALIASMLAFLKALPNPKHTLWYVPAMQVIAVGQTIVDIVMPINHTRDIKERGFCRSVRDEYEQGARRAQELTNAKDWVWPQHYEGDSHIYLYFLPEFRALFHQKVPFGIAQATRFEHQWIMAHQGAGKTTLLSAQIVADLDRVARNECSLFIMDSQDEHLTNYLPKLARFAPGGDLDGKLVYIEPDMEFPPALNIFDINVARMKQLDANDRLQLTRSAMEMIEFFLSSLLNLSLTEKQNIPFRFIVPAVMQIPNATVFTLHDLLKDDGYHKYKHHLGGLAPKVKEWFETHYAPRAKGALKDIFAESRQEIAYRIEAIYADDLFREMLSYPRNRLDLFKELQESKVIIINTKKGRLRTLTEAWGRFFIARLLQAAEERMLMLKSHRTPCFAYIDEAADYIAREQNIAELFFKARKQKVGMVIAHHDETDIKEPRVLAALRKASIRVSPISKGVFTFDIRDKGAYDLPVPNVDFEHLPPMKPAQWEILLGKMRAAYCVPAAGADLHQHPVHSDTYDKA
jgi:hypothetical protein